MAAVTLQELAAELGAELVGDGSVEITGIAGLADAEAGQLSFLANRKYAAAALETRASALIVGRDWDRESGSALLKVDHPDHAFMLAARRFAPAPVDIPEGIHRSAVVDPSARIGEGVRIGPCAVIEPGVVLGARCRIGAGTYVGHEAVLGDDVHLFPNVTVRERCRLGSRVIVHSGTVIGSDGFGYVADEKGVRTKVPQTGIVVLGDDVELGANVTIDRARFGQTVVGKGVKIDNLVQIAHNVVIGEHSVIVAQVGIAGSTQLGQQVIVAGQAGMAGHLKIGDRAVVGSRAGVTGDVDPGAYVMDFPAIPQRDFLRIHRQHLKLPEFRERLVSLEKEVADLKAALREPPDSASQA